MLPLTTAFISPGGGELIMIILVLILLFGAKDAPRIFRSIHTFLDKMQRTAADFRYKIMYGDLYADTTDPAPYDAEEAPDDAEEKTAPEAPPASERTDSTEKPPIPNAENKHP